MKQIKFNNPENLKALLNGTKKSTIRKAYQPILRTMDFQIKNGKPVQRKEWTDKPCKYEVGEEVEFRWTGDINFLDDNSLIFDLKEGWFLGKVKIKSIEKIEIGFIHKSRKLANKSPYWEIVQGHKGFIAIHRETCEWTQNLSKTEGFDSVESMFKYFESYAPEIKERAMPFWLIGWD